MREDFGVYAFKDVKHHKRVGWEQIQFGQLFFIECILNRERMNIQLSDERLQRLKVRVAVIQPQIAPRLDRFMPIFQG